MVLLLFSCQDLQVEDPMAAELALPDNSVSNLVPGRYIVTLHDNTVNFRKSDKYADVQVGMRKLAQDVLISHKIEPDKVKGVYGHAFIGFVLDLSTEELVLLIKDPIVKSIEQDSYILESYDLRKSASEQKRPLEYEGGGANLKTANQESGTGGTVQNGAPKYLDRIDQRQLPLDDTYTYTETGKGVTAYIPVGTIWAEYDGIMDRVVNIDLLNEDPDKNGVTTEKALTTGGMSYGPAKGVKLVGIRTFTGCCDNPRYLSATISAYDWILANGERPGIVLTSLIRDADNSAYFTALKSLYQAGFSLFTSSGAWGEDACTWASSYRPYVFTVGMANINDEKNCYSNYGDCIDLFTSTPDWGSEDGYFESWIDGFSMNPNFVSVGVAAGVAARYLEINPSASPDDVYHFLKQTSTKNIVKLSNSINNHLLYSGMTMEGAGDINPERVNTIMNLMGSSTKLRSNKFQVNLQWDPILDPSRDVDVYENGKKIATTSIGNACNGGSWRYEVDGRKIAPRKYKICLLGTSKCSNEVTVTF